MKHEDKKRRNVVTQESRRSSNQRRGYSSSKQRRGACYKKRGINAHRRRNSFGKQRERNFNERNCGSVKTILGKKRRAEKKRSKDTSKAVVDRF